MRDSVKQDQIAGKGLTAMLVWHLNEVYEVQEQLLLDTNAFSDIEGRSVQGLHILLYRRTD